MTESDIKRVCVVGAGNMGHQISLCCAIEGYQVKCTDVIPEVLKKADDFAGSYLAGRISKGKMDTDAARLARKNISFSSDLAASASDADVVIEAATENLDLKKKLFGELDQICPPHTILATNSSFIVSSKIAPVTKRPAQVCNMHFFNPALVMKLVEVVKGPHTSEETARTIFDFAKKLQKIPVMLNKEISGFLVNRILRALTDEALFIHDMGIASYQDIDTAVVNALGHPMGPFRLMDLTGVDLYYDVCMEQYRNSGNPCDKPSPLVVEKYVKNQWGKKKGKGFYDYNNQIDE